MLCGNHLTKEIDNDTEQNAEGNGGTEIIGEAFDTGDDKADHHGEQ